VIQKKKPWHPPGGGCSGFCFSCAYESWRFQRLQKQNPDRLMAARAFSFVGVAD